MKSTEEQTIYFRAILDNVRFTSEAEYQFTGCEPLWDISNACDTCRHSAFWFMAEQVDDRDIYYDWPSRPYNYDGHGRYSLKDINHPPENWCFTYTIPLYALKSPRCNGGFRYHNDIFTVNGQKLFRNGPDENDRQHDYMDGVFMYEPPDDTYDKCFGGSWRYSRDEVMSYSQRSGGAFTQPCSKGGHLSWAQYWTCNEASHHPRATECQYFESKMKGCLLKKGDEFFPPIHAFNSGAWRLVADLTLQIVSLEKSGISIIKQVTYENQDFINSRSYKLSIGDFEVNFSPLMNLPTSDYSANTKFLKYKNTIFRYDFRKASAPGEFGDNGFVIDNGLYDSKYHFSNCSFKEFDYSETPVEREFEVSTPYFRTMVEYDFPVVDFVGSAPKEHFSSSYGVEFDVILNSGTLGSVQGGFKRVQVASGYSNIRKLMEECLTGTNCDLRKTDLEMTNGSMKIPNSIFLGTIQYTVSSNFLNIETDDHSVDFEGRSEFSEDSFNRDSLSCSFVFVKSGKIGGEPVKINVACTSSDEKTHYIMFTSNVRYSPDLIKVGFEPTSIEMSVYINVRVVEAYFIYIDKKFSLEITADTRSEVRIESKIFRPSDIEVIRDYNKESGLSGSIFGAFGDFFSGILGSFGIFGQILGYMMIAGVIGAICFGLVKLTIMMKKKSAASSIVMQAQPPAPQVTQSQVRQVVSRYANESANQSSKVDNDEGNQEGDLVEDDQG